MFQDAQSEAKGALAEPSPEQRAFLDGGLALQKLNPEITFSADFLAGLVIDGTRFYAGEHDRSSLPVPAASLHLQHVLDPFSMFKSALHICPEHGLHLGEVYVSWVGLIPSLSFSVGRFRQTFGVPSVLAHLKNDYDLTDSTYLELGLTGMLGVNNHTYLGLHVLKRRVIFVDLALAQIAALGTTVGFFFGIMPETPGALLFSMAFTFVGAAVFAVTRIRHERVPQEAVIGLTDAIACALAVLVVDKTQGAEHLKDILVGTLLWVKWSDVGLAAAMSLVIGVIHYVFRAKFLMICKNPRAAYRAGLLVRAWDFLFYFTFGVVITSSTRVEGVLLVSVFLVAPAILAFILTTKLRLQLLIGWTMGTVVTAVGLYLSWTLDLPSDPSVIAFYGVALALGGIAVAVWRSDNRGRTLRAVATGTAVAAVVAVGLWAGSTALGRSSISVSDEARQVEAELAEEQAHARAQAAEVQDQRTQALAARVGRCVGHNKIARYLAMVGPEERLTHVRQKAAENARAALEFLLISLADEELPLLYREEASELLPQLAGGALLQRAGRNRRQPAVPGRHLRPPARAQARGQRRPAQALNRPPCTRPALHK